MSSSTPGWILDARLHIAVAAAAITWLIGAGAKLAPGDDLDDNQFNSAHVVRYVNYGPEPNDPTESIARH